MPRRKPQGWPAYMIAKRLKGETVPFLDLESTGSFWERIQRLAGRK